jgi:hypothetical protein
LWQQLSTLVTGSFFWFVFLLWPPLLRGGFVLGLGIFFLQFYLFLWTKFSSYKSAFAPTSSLQILSKQNKAWVGCSLVWSCSREHIPFQLLLLLTPRFLINNCGRKIHSSFHDLLVFCCCCCCGVLGVEILQTCELVFFCVFVCCFDIGTRLDSRFVTVEEPSTDLWTLIFTKVPKPNFIFLFFLRLIVEGFFFL